MPDPDNVSSPDAVAARLDALLGRLEREFSGAVEVNVKPARWAESIVITSVEPQLQDRCGVWWWHDDDEIQFGVGEHAYWERRADLDAVDLLEQLLEAAAAGDVTEHIGMNDVVVRITLPNGRRERYLAISQGNLFRLPWHRKRRYLPWQAD